MSPRVVALLVLLASAAHPVAIAGLDVQVPLPPAAAYAERQNHRVVVSWTHPAPQPPDAFNVYGLSSEGWNHLAEVAGSVQSAEVDGSFPLYGVSTTSGGLESAVTIAGSVPCARLDMTEAPPVLTVGSSCSDAFKRFGVSLSLP